MSRHRERSSSARSGALPALPLVLASLLAPLLLLVAPSCTDSPARDRSDRDPLLIVTQVPRSVPAGSRVEGPYPQGSRVVVARPPGETRVISAGFEAAGGPALSPDGERLLFAGRRDPRAAWGIHETGLGGGRIRTLIQLDRDCVDPVYIAGGRIAFSCRDVPAAAARDAQATWSIYTASRSGAEIERITFGVGASRTPALLADGRMLFSMEVDGTARLYTVNPDGTLVAALTDDHGARTIERRPRADDGDRVLFLDSEAGGGPTRLRRFDQRRSVADPIALETVAGDEAGAVLLTPLAAEPWTAGSIVVAARPRELDATRTAAAAGSAAVFLLRADRGAAERIFDDPEWDEVEAVPVVRRGEPRGRPSAIDMQRSSGLLVCYDTRRSDGVVGPPAGAPDAASVAIDTVHTLDPALTLGHAPVAEDGSVYLEVPSDVPIRVRSLDAAGEPIAGSSWFWVRPGEVRACFGCHEPRATAPENRVVAALAGEPAVVTLPGGGSR